MLSGDNSQLLPHAKCEAENTIQSDQVRNAYTNGLRGQVYICGVEKESYKIH